MIKLIVLIVLIIVLIIISIKILSDDNTKYSIEYIEMTEEGSNLCLSKQQKFVTARLTTKNWETICYTESPPKIYVFPIGKTE